MAKRKEITEPIPTEPLRLDLGCGPNKRTGFVGVDSIAFPGVDVVTDLRGPWPWKDGTVAEVHCSHFVEHLTAIERVHFVNELQRVLMPSRKVNGVNVEGFATIICPHWASCRAYGDPTHQWPPVSEFWFYYLSKEWRATNAPHTDAANMPGGFACDFEASWGYSVHPQIQARSQDAQQFAFAFYKEAIQDLMATLTKK